MIGTVEEPRLGVVVPKITLGALLTSAVLSLLMSGWALIGSIDESENRRSVEERLVCLEQPGPNDCGVDGR
jgi:hypothetical protein